MVQINYIAADGTHTQLDLKPGFSVMEAAVRKSVPGIDGDCGGACACATCHVYVDEAWLNRVEKPAPAELAMLECADNVRPSSRLSCQLKVTEALNGLVVHTPETQNSQ